MAKDFPAQWGRSDQYRNPDGTLPLPSPTDVPRPLWVSQKQKLQWIRVSALDGPLIVGGPFDPFPVGVIWTYRWSSPAFDLRPDLRSAQAGPKDGSPVWGTACRLYVQMMSDAAGSGSQPELNTENLTVSAVDWINDIFNYSGDRRPADAIGSTGGAGLLNSAPVDVSSKFAVPPGSATTSLAVFSPPGTTSGTGEGYPVRYWRLELIFRKFVETVFPVPDPPPLPTFTPVLQVSMY